MWDKSKNTFVTGTTTGTTGTTTGITGTGTGTTTKVAKLPKTGQTKCYSASGGEISCAGTGQDGELQKGVASPSPRFTVDITGSCVIDNLTGLMWSKDANMWEALNWQSALDKVKGLNQSGGLCGYIDWRLPNADELESLVDLQNINPTLPTGHPFSNVVFDGGYWSSTTGARVTALVWVVFMSNGHMTYARNDYQYKTRSRHVWPVRSGAGGVIDLPKTGQTKCYSVSGGEISCAGTGQDGELQKGVASPNPRFTVDTTGSCVTDNQTGLMWSKDANMWGLLNWQSALDKVKWLNQQGGGLCGYTDWRLPNMKELMSLIDKNYSNIALPTGHPFSNVQSGNYWSSTTLVFDTPGAWLVHMSDGNMHGDPKSNFNYVWPVRSGQ